ncbi:hypothetical protein P691DRAFT_856003 [Macrolepiota fuliginosa MF-IS2]|uniref:F-box domain-containing protein n=1 Tax=Macrolepiota fuliginosa MF-IS2 TaxID=1400762 RepID=A0A9P5WYJ7_9AGAR|nr:hypothetical protein P691DRAFT_856003 [Macrolepiota fuliginosa MF-IS2]
MSKGWKCGTHTNEAQRGCIHIEEHSDACYTCRGASRTLAASSRSGRTVFKKQGTVASRQATEVDGERRVQGVLYASRVVWTVLMCGGEQVKGTQEMDAEKGEKYNFARRYSKFSAPNTALQEMESELCEAEIAYAASLQRLTIARRNHNIWVSPIGKLPPELLRSVFRCLCAFPPFHSFEDVIQRWFDLCRQCTSTRLRLGVVCHQWRCVQQESHDLWKGIAFSVQHRPLNEFDEVLRSFIENSGGRRLTVALSFVDRCGPSVPVERFVGSLERVEQLTIIQPPPAWIPHIVNRPGLIELNLVKAKVLRGFRTGTLLAGCCNLRHILLELDSTSITYFHAVGSMTSASLVGTKTSAAVKFLFYCPNLVSFHFGPVSAEGNSPLDLDIPLFTRDRLEEFSRGLRKAGCPWNVALLTKLRLPGLRELRWNDNHTHGADSHHAARTFFAHLPSTVSSLRLECVNWNNGTAHLGAFTFETQIERLYLLSCSGAFIKVALQAPQPFWRDRMLVKRLPKLHTLLVKVSRSPTAHRGCNALNAEYSNLVVGLLDKRLEPLRNPAFRLELVSTQILWQLKDITNLQGMV